MSEYSHIDGTLDDFFAQGTTPSSSTINGNTAWAQSYSRELRGVVARYADRLPRTLQRHLGPSELGHECDRQVIGKMAGFTFRSGTPNNLHDPWASVVGTAIHAFLEDAFQWDAKEPDPSLSERENGQNFGRWFAERRVTPDPGAAQPHPGTADLYDARNFCLNDHKCQSENVRDKLRSSGPPVHYFVQMLLYALGYMYEGFRVDRVVLISWPRTKSTMDDIYVWEHVITPQDIEYVGQILKKTETREQLAQLVTAGVVDMGEIPAAPSDADCQYCPFFNPRVGVDPSARGCSGKPSGNWVS